jgi:succinate-semialdehyde dehydrogenase/glutarate-semialdehyde dehydrogenase
MPAGELDVDRHDDHGSGPASIHRGGPVRHDDPEVRKVLAAVPTDLLIGGSWQPAARGTFDVHDPATGGRLAAVADAGAAEAMAALDAAAIAQLAWGESAPRARADLLLAAHAAVLERRDDFATLMTLEMGKPLAESHAELDYAADFLRWFAEEAVRIDGGYLRSPRGRARILVTHRPVGPCLLITPWNFPLAMATRKIAPALAAGCTAVLKPAELTPLTSLLLAQVLLDCGLPAGVLNVVPTSEPGPVVRPLLEDGRIRKLSFTGSTAVGKVLLAQSAAKVVRTSMELGGNAPFLVFADADLDRAVEAAVLAKMRNGGEACTASNRMYVAREVAGEFARRLAARLAAMPLGHGLDPGTEVGPLIDRSAVAKVQDLVDDAVGRGAQVLTGGGRAAEPAVGWFFQPTVLADVSADARLMREEIFGPVAPVVPFDTEEQAVRWANETEYGLVAYVFTENLDRAFRVGEALEVGMVGLNQGVVSDAAAPFGGVKESGMGREGGRAGIREYLDTKYLAVPC